MESNFTNRISKKEILLNNLLLLGLRPEEVLKSSKIEISIDTFEKYEAIKQLFYDLERIPRLCI